MHRRVRKLERVLEQDLERRVEERLEQELVVLFDRLERELPADTFLWVMAIAAEEENRYGT